MGPNLLLALISALLAAGPYISQIELINGIFHYHPARNVGGGFQAFVIFVGCFGVCFALFNIFLKKKNGSPYLAMGALVITVEFFVNSEKVPLPLNEVLFGGEMFFIFVTGLVMAVTGLVVEWLLPQPH
ncbi:MAG: hypothetical protein U0V70_16950 [Terriglobia bacterium]